MPLSPGGKIMTKLQILKTGAGTGSELLEKWIQLELHLSLK
jgi:hypothetical protein